MRSLHTFTVLSAFFLVGIASGCTGPETQALPTQAAAPVEFNLPQATQPPTRPPTQTAPLAADSQSAAEDPEPAFVDFAPHNFSDSTNIDNTWSPMQPGMHWVYEGTIIEEGVILPHRIEFSVTDLVKEIQGVRTVVAWSLDYTGGKLTEKEIAFYAQDNDGTVWYMGEYPEEFENDQFIKAPTWIAGIEGARAGVKMQADPQLNAAPVFQGWGPAVEWSDYGNVDQMGLKICVPVSCYEDVLVVAETSLAEKGAFQLKYFAPGVGEIQVGWRGADLTQEELVLTDYGPLSPQALAEVRALASDLEKHGYEVSKDVYGQTSPMK